MKKIFLYTVIFLLSCLTLYSSKDKGVTWDEPVFFEASNRVYNWVTSFDYLNKEYYYDVWNFDSEHPPGAKLLCGLFYNLAKPFFDFAISFRFFNAILLYLLLSFIVNISKTKNNIASQLILIAFVFMNLHLINFVQISSKEFMSAVLYSVIILIIAYEEFTLTNIIKIAVIVGLSLLVKINNFLILPILVITLLAYDKNRFKDISVILGLGLLIFITSWPYLWDDPFHKLYKFFWLFDTHFNIPTYFMGRTYKNPPFYYPLLMTCIVLPLPLLTGLAIFCIHSVRDVIKEKRIKREYFCLLLGFLLPILFFLRPGMPRYDGIRLFLSSILLISVIAGLTYSSILIRFRRASVCFLVIVIIYNGYLYRKYHPYESSYFSEVIGGINGAEELGMEIQYWHEAFNQDILDFLKKLPVNTTVISYPTNNDLEDFYSKLGLFPENISYKGDPDYFILPTRQGLFTQSLWDLYLNKKPVYSKKIDNVQIIGIYDLAIFKKKRR